MSNAPRYVLEQPASRAAALLSFAVFLPAACSIFVPLGLVAAHASDVATAAKDQPLATAQVMLGMIIWILLFVLPVVRRLRVTGLSRSLVINNGKVEETTRTLFRAHRTETPLSHFRGIVHRVQTSVGGMQHELALVERTSGRWVVFQQAPKLGREHVEAAISALGLPELRAGDLSSMPALRDAIRIAPMAHDFRAAA
jgi:hypothetical protein